MIKVNRLLKSRYLKDVTILASGTLVSQLILVASTPFLTRLYTPEDFGKLALFMAFVSSISPVVCGRYEMALLVVKSDVRAKQLLGLALQIAVLFSSLIFVVLILIWMSAVNLLNSKSLEVWVLLVPFAILLNGIIVSLNYYSNRLSEYNIISKSKIIQSVTSVIVMILFGLIHFNYEGLIFGTAIGLLVAAVWLLKKYHSTLAQLRGGCNKKVLNLLKRYYVFPVYNAPSSMLDAITVILPVFFFPCFTPKV